jgi:hypothetical protein
MGCKLFDHLSAAVVGERVWQLIPRRHQVEITAIELCWLSTSRKR